MSGEGDGWMRRALALGWSAAGRTSPNPAVGAVLVRGGEAVGEGATQPPGGAHAEIMALRQAGRAARGATLYVTLEPCSHHGRTPPCTDALIAAGVGAVHYAVADPNPLVAGRGRQALQAVGITVVAGECASEAAWAHEAFFTYITRGRPFVIAKWAMSLDGKIATRTGDSRWISGAAARRRVHQLRDTVDAICAGSGTVLADDPALTTRLEGAVAVHHPLRVVLDARGRTPLNAQVLSGALPGRTLVATTQEAPRTWRAAVAEKGSELLLLPPSVTSGLTGGVDLATLLADLGRRGCTSLLVEGGGTVLASFFTAGLVDKALVFLAPLVIGGQNAPSPVQGIGVDLLRQAGRWRIAGTDACAPDVLVTAYPIRPDEGPPAVAP